MKNKIVTAIAVLTLGASLAIAAPHDGKFGGKRGRHGMMGERLAEKLNLTDAQKEQIRAIKQETREQNAAFFQSLRQTRQDLRAAREANDTAKLDALKGTLESQHAQMKQIRDAENAKISALLTAEQNAKWQQLQAQRGERGEHHRQ